MTRVVKLPEVLLADVLMFLFSWFPVGKVQIVPPENEKPGLYYHFVFKRTKCQMPGQIYIAFSFDCHQADRLKHCFDMCPQQWLLTLFIYLFIYLLTYSLWKVSMQCKMYSLI